MKSSLLCFALFLCAFVECRTCTAEAQPARVDATQLCAVKVALHRGRWSPRMCERVSEALNSTPDPVLFSAIWVLESGMNEKAIKVVRPGVYDIGGAQVRCVTAVALAEEIGSSSAGANGGPTSNADSTLKTKGKTHEAQGTGPWIAENQPITIPRDRCTNGAARGLYANQLLDPAINIRTAAAVLESHRGSLRGYSGSTKERGYGARIAVLVAAFGGELRIPKGAHGKKWARVIALAKRIIGAINQERKQS